MTSLAQQCIERLHRSAEPIGIESPNDHADRLGTEVIRLARLATSIHLAQAARLLLETDHLDWHCGGFLIHHLIRS